MDINVTCAGPGRWVLTDLLGRIAGRIEQQRPGMFRIVPAERYGELLRDVSTHSFETLDHALSAVEIVTRGACRLAPPPPLREPTSPDGG